MHNLAFCKQWQETYTENIDDFQLRMILKYRAMIADI